MRSVLERRALMATLGVALAAASCAPELPASPTWTADVRPILLARCGRCHDNSQWKEDPRRPAPTSVFTSVEEPEGMADAFQFALPLLRATGPERMPPPPAEPLADWQLEILERWSNKPQP